MVAEGQAELARELLQRLTGLVVVESGLMIFINFMAFTGNVMVCWAVYRNQRLRTITNMYVVTLAISDALMAVLCMPLSIVLLITGEWPFSGTVCQLQGFFCFFWALVSLLLMTATAVNRFFRVVKPSLYRQYFKVKYTCLSIIALTLLAALGAGLLPLITQWATFTVHYGKVMCFMNFKTPLLDKSYIAYLDVVDMATPIGIISFAYYTIFKTIKRHNLELNATRQRATVSINVEEVKITKALFAAVLGFSLCWGSVAVIDMIDSYTEHKLAIPRRVFMLYIFLGSGSSAINPIIYGVMAQAFRAEFLRILTFCRRRDEVVIAPVPAKTLQTHWCAANTNQFVCDQV